MTKFAFLWPSFAQVSFEGLEMGHQDGKRKVLNRGQCARETLFTFLRWGFLVFEKKKSYEIKSFTIFTILLPHTEDKKPQQRGFHGANYVLTWCVTCPRK